MAMSIFCDARAARGSTSHMFDRTRPSTTTVVALAALLAVAACGTGSSTGGALDGGAGDSGRSGFEDSDGGGSFDAQECSSTTPAAQGLSQACCLSWGADACGAGLFCGAFDGRTKTTCYPEHSRADGETCTENLQCVNKVCDPTTKACKPQAPVTPPPEMKCPSSCSTNAACQNQCPAAPGAIQCCDRTASACYASKTPTCPGG